MILISKRLILTAVVFVTLVAADTIPPAAPMKHETQIPITIGKTSLLDIGLYQVACQSYGKDAIFLPPNFMGSDSTTGVIYVTADEIHGDNGPVEVAEQGTRVSIIVPAKVRPSDKLFKLETQ